MTQTIHSNFWYDRYMAVEDIEDQSILIKVATEDGDPDVRQHAMERVKDQSVLARVLRAEGEDDMGVKLAAVAAMTKESLQVLQELVARGDQLVANGWRRNDLGRALERRLAELISD